jgi:hypothetical protein
VTVKTGGVTVCRITLTSGTGGCALNPVSSAPAVTSSPPLNLRRQQGLQPSCLGETQADHDDVSLPMAGPPDNLGLPGGTQLPVALTVRILLLPQGLVMVCLGLNL